MSYPKDNIDHKCQVCGGNLKQGSNTTEAFVCKFCGFRKLSQNGDMTNSDLIAATDVNVYFRNLYSSLKHQETTTLCVPVHRFYKSPLPQKGQINFFKSKNIMFLLEQHGFQMVNRKSRYSTELNLIIRKV